MKHLLYFVVMAAAMLVLSHYMPGVHVSGWTAALLAAVVLALMNAIVKPILFVLTLPFTLLTLGLFLLVLNAITLWLTTLVVPGFHIDGAWTTFFAALLLTLVGTVWKAVTSGKPS